MGTIKITVFYCLQVKSLIELITVRSRYRAKIPDDVPWFVIGPIAHQNIYAR